MRKLRQSVHRVARRGWAITAHDGREIDAWLETEIELLSARWRDDHPRVHGFAMGMGSFTAELRPDDLYLLARSPAGELGGVMRFVTCGQSLSLDTMQRVGDTPNGLNEALVVRALAVARERGVAEVSLNYAGLAHLVRGEPSRNRSSRGADAPGARTAAPPLPDGPARALQREVLAGVAPALPRLRVPRRASARRRARAPGRGLPAAAPPQPPWRGAARRACPAQCRPGCDRPARSGRCDEAPASAPAGGDRDRGAGRGRADRRLQLLGVLLPAPRLCHRRVPPPRPPRAPADRALLLAGAAPRGRLHRLHAARL